MNKDIDVLVHEVGPRDGLQSIDTIFSTKAKLDCPLWAAGPSF